MKVRAVREAEEASRQASINAKVLEWGIEICEAVRRKDLGIGMTEAMVRLSWGPPTTVETKEILKSGVRTRWIYGVPRHGARYLTFKNGILEKIKN